MEQSDKPNAAPDASAKAPEDMSVTELKTYIDSLPPESQAGGEDKQAVASESSEEGSATVEEPAGVAGKEPEAKAADNPNELEQLKAELERLKAENETTTKSYKSLQAEFTRRSQAEKAKDKSTDKTQTSKLARLKETNPETAELLESIIDERVSEKVKPIEEERAIYRKRQNIATFDSAVKDFKKSDLAELEPQVMEVFNENPKYWVSALEEDPNTFSYLLKEALLRDVIGGKRKVVEIVSKKKNEKIVAETQKNIVDESGVLTKGKTSAVVVPDVDKIKKMSLQELSKLVPRT